MLRAHIGDPPTKKCSRSVRIKLKTSYLRFENRISGLIAEIMTAFDGVSREDGTTLHEAMAIDDYKSDEEQQAARGFDTEQRWQDVPDEEILACESALSFLDAKGFRYYLPAFMVSRLKNWGNSL